MEKEGSASHLGSGTGSIPPSFWRGLPLIYSNRSPPGFQCNWKIGVAGLNLYKSINTNKLLEFRGSGCKSEIRRPEGARMDSDEFPNPRPGQGREVPLRLPIGGETSGWLRVRNRQGRFDFWKL